MGEHEPCHVCGFELWVPVIRLRGMTVGLYDDATFPGRCLISLDRHFEHLDELPPSLAFRFVRAQQRVSQALREVTGCARVNVAVLGNTVPHIHAHVIPRFDHEVLPTRTPWEQPNYDRRGKLSERRRQHLRLQLHEVLARPRHEEEHRG